MGFFLYNFKTVFSVFNFYAFKFMSNVILQKIFIRQIGAVYRIYIEFSRTILYITKVSFSIPCCVNCFELRFD